jgi:hypothetical protein
LNPPGPLVTLTAFGGPSRADSLGLLMVSTIALVAALLAVLFTALAVWRVTRRLLTAGHLEDISVSRQWLLQHQDER